LGKANKSESEVFLDVASKDKARVLKRLGGGGAVVLTKGVLVISIAKFVKGCFDNQLYFDKINDLIIDGLGDLNIRNLSKRGISDICLGDKKILGASIYRRIRMLFYQASLLVNADTKIISRYLRHPSKEPAYRRGRKHEDFVTTITEEGYRCSTKEIKRTIMRKFDDYLWAVN
jgi:lipoate-protein ligase A